MLVHTPRWELCSATCPGRGNVPASFTAFWDTLWGALGLSEGGGKCANRGKALVQGCRSCFLGFLNFLKEEEKLPPCPCQQILAYHLLELQLGFNLTSVLWTQIQRSVEMPCLSPVCKQEYKCWVSFPLGNSQRYCARTVFWAMLAICFLEYKASNKSVILKNQVVT